MRNSLAPGIYTGKVRHRRFTPAAHDFEYTLFMAFLDIDRIPDLMAASRWTGYEKRALLSYWEKDHFGDPSAALRDRLRLSAAKDGFRLPDGPIYLLTNLRYAGYCFNPISLYYCYERGAAEPSLAMAEVNNTFGENHNYWLNGLQVDGVDKKLHVSPFNTMDNQYNFRLSAPADRLVAHIDSFRSGERFFDATLMLDWSPWTAQNLRHAAVAFPLMTSKIIAAIHWEAIKLFFKRVPFAPHCNKQI